MTRNTDTRGGRSQVKASIQTFRLYRWWQQSIVGTVDHERVTAQIVAESRWSARYAFMTMMSAGIAVLGLLLSSPAVVIGAMLISPLMSPVLGLGFSLALFDFAELRRSISALSVGTLAAVLFSAGIVLASPLKAPTVEILARTRPNLFDLLVALFAALAGTFAIIKGRGDTIAGVAIATALMPPLAVIGYGLATWNLPVLGGSLALFATNCITIALAASVTARFYGFGRSLSATQNWKQTILLLLVFVSMAVPLAVSLRRIAGEALMIREIRTLLSDRFGTDSRVSQLDVDFDQTPIAIRSVVIAPHSASTSQPDLRRDLEEKLGQPIDLEVSHLLLDPGPRSIETQRAELRQAANDLIVDAASETRRTVARLVAGAASVPPDSVMLDSERKRAVARAAELPGAGLETYHALEARVAAMTDAWEIEIVPPLVPLPLIHFANGVDSLDAAARQAVELSAWAARRWQATAVGVPGLPSVVPAQPRLAQRRGLAIAALLREQKLLAVPAPEAGREFRLLPFVLQTPSVR